MNAILRCHERFHLGERRGLSRHIYVVNGDQALPRYEFMCAAIDDALDAEVLQAWLTAVEKIESGAQKEIEKSTEGWEFTLSREGVRFEGLYDQGTGGEVSLAQFKLAVQTYLRFLQDPERKPVEVPFPEE